MNLTQDEILQILRLLDESKFDELDLQVGAFKLRVKRRGAVKGAPGGTESIISSETETISRGVQGTPVSDSEMVKSCAPLGPPGQSPGYPLRRPSTQLGSAQGDLSTTSPPSRPSPERGPTAGGRGTSREVEMNEQEKGWSPIRAPILGTFYRRPSPEEPPFVDTGAFVSENDTVCLLEVMKVFNTVKAGVRGYIEKICVESGELVEFGQILFWVRP